jgi:hypothetical protein
MRRGRGSAPDDRVLHRLPLDVLRKARLLARPELVALGIAVPVSTS